MNDWIKYTCPSYYWKLFHNLHGDGVGITDMNDIDMENYPYQPAYICDQHYLNHFKKLSLREMKILEPEELEYSIEQEDSWRMIMLLDGKKAWRKILN